MSEVAVEDTASAPKAEEPRVITIGNVTLPMKDVLRAITDRDLYHEADRRGLVDEWGDYVHPQNTVASDLRKIPDWVLRQDIQAAMRDVESVLCNVDSRFIGFADDVDRHYRRAS